MQLATTNTAKPAATPTIGHNKPSFDDLMTEARKFGAAVADGGDAQIQFDLMLIEGAFKGTLSVDKNKHGPGRSDAVVLCEAYTRARGKAQFNVKANREKSFVSTSNKCIEVGSMTNLGTGQPMKWVQDYVDLFKLFRAQDPSAAKKLPAGKSHKDLNDAHNALMKVLTKQKRLDSLLTEKEVIPYMFKADREEKTHEDALADIRKALGKTGDKSVEITGAVTLITKRLADLAKGAK